MERNFFRRIEVAFPILDAKLKKRVIEEGLKVYLADNVQAWEMYADGHYERLKPVRSPAISAQIQLLAELSAQSPVEETVKKALKAKKKAEPRK
jgi:polyphosphate kinase